jgi:hypothetical protein
MGKHTETVGWTRAACLIPDSPMAVSCSPDPESCTQYHTAGVPKTLTRAPGTEGNGYRPSGHLPCALSRALGNRWDSTPCLGRALASNTDP